MHTLRTHIGNHDGARPGALCRVELESFVMRAGRAAGLKVRAEVRVAGHTGVSPVTGELDCAWLDPVDGRYLVMFEFDGRDVGRGHIEGTHKRLGNAKKFEACGAELKVQVLYGLRNDLTQWGPSQRDRCQRLLGAGVRVVSDEELMAPGGIERLVEEACKLRR